MNTPSQLTISSDGKTEQSHDSLARLIEQSNQAIEQSRAEIARSQALSQAEADLARFIERLAHEQDNPGDGDEAASPGVQSS